jgi:hypothetical protein
MPQVTLLDVPAAAIGALLVVAAVRWAWRDARRRPWQWGLVIGLALLSVWRILRMQDGPLTTIDVMLGFLAGLLLFNAIKTAWSDGPFERDVKADGFGKGYENSALLPFILAGSLAALLLVYGFGCLGLLTCEANGWRWLAWEYPGPSEQITTLPAGGVHVDELPPGNWK